MYVSQSTKVKEFELFVFQSASNLNCINFNFNSEQFTAINHSYRQDNLHNTACVGLL